MNSTLTRIATTGIGRKVAMAVTGLLLIGFLVAHLAGNLLIFSGADAFNGYSHALVSNPLIYLAEVALLVFFVVHLANGMIVTLGNRGARPVPYHRKSWARHTSNKSLSSATMIFTGIVVLAFVPLHVWTFKFGPYYESAAEAGVRDLHRLVIEVFGNPLIVAWYVLAMVVIGFHLWHGFGSGFESLGFASRKSLRRFGQGLAVLLAAGFLLIPVVVYLGGSAS